MADARAGTGTVVHAERATVPVAHVVAATAPATVSAARAGTGSVAGAYGATVALAHAVAA